MPKLGCRCGYVHDLSPIPDAGWLTIRDADYEPLIEAEHLRLQQPDSDPLVDAADSKYHDSTGSLYECPECHRLLWQRPGTDHYECFAPEPPPSA